MSLPSQRAVRFCRFKFCGKICNPLNVVSFINWARFDAKIINKHIWLIHSISNRISRCHKTKGTNLLKKSLFITWWIGWRTVNSSIQWIWIIWLCQFRVHFFTTTFHFGFVNFIIVISSIGFDIFCYSVAINQLPNRHFHLILLKKKKKQRKIIKSMKFNHHLTQIIMKFKLDSNH